MRGDGRVFTRGGVWWIAYYAPKDGRRVERREPAMVSDREGEPRRPARTEAEARRFLRQRVRDVIIHVAGVRPFQGPEHERVSLEELLQALEREYEVRRLASLPQLRSHLKHVRAYFGEARALGVTYERLLDFVTTRQRDGASPASINRQLEAIRRAFTLAATRRVIGAVPAIPTLTVRNARQGFVSRAQFEALMQHIPEADLRDFTEFAFWTGMRKGEISKLTWDAFDEETTTLRLHARDAKTGHGRTLALAGPIEEIVRRRLAARRDGCGLIFHRAGAPVREFRKTWAAACRQANLPHIRFHDLRRSAIRNLVRAGVDPAIAMKISGHRTRAVFDRYNIVSEDDLRNAMRKTAEYFATLPSALLPSRDDSPER